MTWRASAAALHAVGALATLDNRADAAGGWLHGDGRIKGGCCAEICCVHGASAVQKAPVGRERRLGRLSRKSERLVTKRQRSETSFTQKGKWLRFLEPLSVYSAISLHTTNQLSRVSSRCCPRCSLPPLPPQALPLPNSVRALVSPLNKTLSASKNPLKDAPLS